MTNSLIQLADMLGVFGGVIALSIAIYLQMVRAEECPVKIPILYASAGLALLMITNSIGNVAGHPVQDIVIVLGFLFIITIELVSLWWVMKVTDVSELDILSFDDVDSFK